MTEGDKADPFPSTDPSQNSGRTQDRRVAQDDKKRKREVKRRAA